MIDLVENISLLEYNTFNIDAKARFFCQTKTDDQLRHAIKWCDEKQLPFFVLAGGSNIIFRTDFDGLIIHPTSKGITLLPDNETVIAEAGEEWDELVEWSVQNGLYGLENLSHIPGSVGASPIQNIGAYGAEAADNMVYVEYLNTDTLQIERIEAKDCEFGYRESVFKNSLKGKAVVLRVAFRLTKNGELNTKYGAITSEIEAMGEQVSLKTMRQAIINIRQSKLPDPERDPNAGSFFKNPVVSSEIADKIRCQYPNMPSYDVPGEGVKIPAGWLIDNAGLKGFKQGKVAVHDKQALVIVNKDGANGQEILDFAEFIAQQVLIKYNIKITREVNVL